MCAAPPCAWNSCGVGRDAHGQAQTRRCETCPRRERLLRRACTSKITIGAGHALLDPAHLDEARQRCPRLHLAPALLPNPWPRTPHAAFLRHTSKRAAKRPRFGDTETMNKFGAQFLGRSFLSLLFAGDDDRRLGRANTLDLETIFAVSRATWPQHLATYH